MPHGNFKPGPRHTEVVARETCTGLFLQAMDAAKTNTPQGWATAAQKFDEAADTCRIAEKEFLRRQIEAQDVRPEHRDPAHAVQIHVVELGTFDAIEFLEKAFSCGGGHR